VRSGGHLGLGCWRQAHRRHRCPHGRRSTPPWPKLTEARAAAAVASAVASCGLRLKTALAQAFWRGVELDQGFLQAVPAPRPRGPALRGERATGASSRRPWLSFELGTAGAGVQVRTAHRLHVTVWPLCAQRRRGSQPQRFALDRHLPRGRCWRAPMTADASRGRALRSTMTLTRVQIRYIRRAGGIKARRFQHAGVSVVPLRQPQTGRSRSENRPYTSRRKTASARKKGEDTLRGLGSVETRALPAPQYGLCYRAKGIK